MASYGYEIESVNIQLITNNEVPPKTTYVSVGYIAPITGKLVPILKVTNDMGRLTALGYSYTFEAITAGFNKLDMGNKTYDALDTVITFFENNRNPITNTIMFFADAVVTQGHFRLSVTCPGGRAFTVQMPQNHNNILFNIQFSVGFNAVEDFPRFYNYFEPLTSQSFVLNRNFFINDNGILYLPFAENSWTIFEARFCGMCSLPEETARRLWYLVEFLRIQVAYSFNTVTPRERAWGNKGYVGIMTRVSLRNIEMLPQQFNFLCGLFGLSQTPREAIISYLNTVFSRQTRAIKPYTRLTDGEMSTNNTYGSNAPVMLSPGTRNVLPRYYNAYALAMGEKGLVQYILSAIDNDLNGCGRNFLLLPLAPPPAGTNNIIQNIDQYDYWCPTPYSSDLDPMGYYTRHPPANALIPRIFLEVRYYSDYLERILGTIFLALTPELKVSLNETGNATYRGW